MSSAGGQSNSNSPGAWKRPADTAPGASQPPSHTSPVLSLSPLEREALATIEAFRTYGAHPSIGDIQHSLGLRSKNSAGRTVDHLRQRGLVSRTSDRKRGLVLTSELSKKNPVLKPGLGERAPRGVTRDESMRDVIR